jgi:hypothetical protein
MLVEGISDKNSSWTIKAQNFIDIFGNRVASVGLEDDSQSQGISQFLSLS